MPATAVNDRTQLPSPTWPPSAPPPASFPLTDRPVVLADDPCEAGFSGADPEYTGIYLHARYFDPKLGIFLSPDPLDPMRRGVGLNRYAYGFGNPVNVMDPSGLAGYWAECSDGSGDSCWVNLEGLDVVVEVTVGGGSAGGGLAARGEAL